MNRLHLHISRYANCVWVLLLCLWLCACSIDLNSSIDQPQSQAGAVTEPASANRSGQAGFPKCISPDANVEIGQVVKITDGDTIHVVIDGREYTVRYTSIDAPEDTKEIDPYGPEATALNRKLVDKQRITLVQDVSTTDQYGRLLRYVFVGDRFINYELVRQGLANARSYPPDVACLEYLRSAENAARQNGLGMWADKTSSATDACNCSGADLDCSDFKSRAEAQACFTACKSQGFGDIFHLDGEDQDGRVCENMP